MQESMRDLQFNVFGACLTMLAPNAGCVLNPWAEFRQQAEEQKIGQSFSRRSAEWAPPLTVETSTRGTKIYAFRYFATRPKRDCIVFYEVAEDTIVAAWHKGKDCMITN
jgi:hypothetical protein